MRLKGQTWWFQRDIPANLRPAFGGRKTLTCSLRTSDIRIAQKRRDAAVAYSETAFRGAASNPIDPVRDEAEQWAVELRQALGTDHDDTMSCPTP